MSPDAPSPMPTPERFFEAQSAYQKTAALKGALELDLFTAVGEGSRTADAIASRCEASLRGTRILCDYLTIIGFLEKADGRYALTPDSAAFLDRRSPMYLGSTARFLTSDAVTSAFRDVAALVRKGSTLMEGEGTVETDNPIWVEFARSMASMMGLPAQLIAEQVVGEEPAVTRVLDIAAGHGLFGIAIARRHPNAEIVPVDWPNVLAVARENAERAGVADRFRPIPGDAFAVDFGEGFDVALLTNFLHHFDPPTNVRLLKKVAQALRPGGRAVALEFVPDESRVTPPLSASFSFTMLGTTRAGDAYTFAELEAMFRDAGFASSELRELPPTLQRVVVATR